MTIPEIQLELKEEINILTKTNKYSDEDLEKINEENYQLTKDIKVFQSQTKSYSEIIASMEQQRLALVRVAAEMEKTLSKATSIMGQGTTSLKNNLDWNRKSPTKRNTVSNENKISSES